MVGSPSGDFIETTASPSNTKNMLFPVSPGKRTASGDQRCVLTKADRWYKEQTNIYSVYWIKGKDLNLYDETEKVVFILVFSDSDTEVEDIRFVIAMSNCVSEVVIKHFLCILHP